MALTFDWLIRSSRGLPGPVQVGRQLDHLGDLAVDVALVDQPQRLVMEVGIQVPLLGQEGDDVAVPQAGQWCEANARLASPALPRGHRPVPAGFGSAAVHAGRVSSAVKQ